MNKLAEQHEALGHYIDALLTSGDLAADADGPRPVGAAAPIVESCGLDTGARDFMIVQVRDLKLAIDAARVKSVMPFPASGVDYRDGLPACLQPIGHNGRAIPIVDLRRIVFPEGHAAREDRSPYRYLVVLQGPSIALACDEIGAVITVDSGGVQWRETRATRPWLAGMLRECKCAVIDLSTVFDEPAGAAH